jgi:dihydrolipoamide dehydrogenase
MSSDEAPNSIATATSMMRLPASGPTMWTPRTCHAHPTLTEAVKEAALAVEKRALHM